MSCDNHVVSITWWPPYQISNKLQRTTIQQISIALPSNLTGLNCWFRHFTYNPPRRINQTQELLVYLLQGHNRDDLGNCCKKEIKSKKKTNRENKKGKEVKQFAVSIDERTEASGRFAANAVIGILTPDAPRTTVLLSTSERIQSDSVPKPISSINHPIVLFKTQRKAPPRTRLKHTKQFPFPLTI